jgi:hypothetical protein
VQILLAARTGYALRITSEESWTPHYLTWDVGLMRNVSGKTAVGGTAFLGMDFETYRVGLRGRLRYWLNRDVSLEASPGVLVFGDDNLKFPGFTGDVAVNYQDCIGATARLEIFPRSWDGTHTQAFLGMKLGSSPGATIMAIETIAGLVFAAWAASFWD